MKRHALLASLGIVVGAVLLQWGWRRVPTQRSPDTPAAQTAAGPPVESAATSPHATEAGARLVPGETLIIGASDAAQRPTPDLAEAAALESYGAMLATKTGAERLRLWRVGEPANDAAAASRAELRHGALAQALRAGEADAARPELEAMLASNSPEQIRAAGDVLRDVATTRELDTAHGLLTATCRRSAQVCEAQQRAAFRMLQGLVTTAPPAGDERTQAIVRRWAKLPADPELRYPLRLQLARALASQGDATSVEFLFAEAVRDSDEYLPAYEAALRELRNPEAVPLLARYLAQGQPGDRAFDLAADALAHLPSAQATRALLAWAQATRAEHADLIALWFSTAALGPSDELLAHVQAAPFASPVVQQRILTVLQARRANQHRIKNGSKEPGDMTGEERRVGLERLEG